MDTLSFHAGEFEGPLDALLFLINRRKMNIADIRISDLLDQYISLMQERSMLDLEVTSDFLEMAARLVHIKTLALLPQHAEEAERLRGELTGELIEYRLCQLVAGALREMVINLPSFVRREEPVPEKEYDHKHSPVILAKAYLLATGRKQQRMPPSAVRFQGIVGRRIVPVSVRIRFLLRKLRLSPTVLYEDIFAEGDRSERVATFVALLELIKAGRVKLSETGSHITLSEGSKKIYE